MKTLEGSSKFVLESNNSIFKLTEEFDGPFDELIQTRWLHLMSEGHFRYDLSTVESKKVGKFVAQLNPMRATTRRMPQAMETVRQNFDPLKFNFTKAALEKELICEIVSEDDKNTSDCDVISNHNDAKNQCDAKKHSRDVIIINVSPIEFGHCLLVPSLEETLPQILTESSIRLALKVMSSSGRKNFKMAFNSLCAYASVNHLHWHLYYLQSHQLHLETVPAPVLQEDCHELKYEDYPGQGFVFQVLDSAKIDDTASDVFKLVDFLSKNDISHNVFITRGSILDVTNEDTDTDKKSFDAIRIFVWARQNVVGNKDPAAFVIAVCELSGQLLIYEKSKYDTITEEEITEALTETCQDVFNQVRPDVIKLFE